MRTLRQRGPARSREMRMILLRVKALNTRA